MNYSMRLTRIPKMTMPLHAAAARAANVLFSYCDAALRT
jgi:hypothetical protein